MAEYGPGGILAVVTTNCKLVSGGVPIFIARDDAELEKLAVYLARSLNAMVHDLENGCYVIIRH